MKKNTIKSIAILSGIFSIVIIIFIVYNVVNTYTDNAVNLMINSAQQSIIDQNELQYKRLAEQIMKDYEERLKLVEKQKKLNLKE